MERPPEYTRYASPPGPWKSKLTLRVASVLSLAVFTGLGGWLATSPRVIFDWVMVHRLVAPIVITFCWEMIEFVCIIFRAGHRGVHPGAVVVFEMGAWLAWLGLAVYLRFSGLDSRGYAWIEGYSTFEYGRDGGNLFMRLGEPTKQEDIRLWLAIEKRGIGMVASAFLKTIIHVVLFVIACRETHIRRRLKKHRVTEVTRPIHHPALAEPAPPGVLPIQPAPAYTANPEDGAK